MGDEICFSGSNKSLTTASSYNNSMAGGKRNLDRLVLRVERRFCPHCEQYLSLKTYNAHKRLYYSPSKDEWVRKGSISCDSSVQFENLPPLSFGVPVQSTCEDNGPPSMEYVAGCADEEGTLLVYR